MDFSLLKRDPKAILEHLKELPNGSVITDADAIICVPARFAERNLVKLGADIYICGIYAIVIGNKYGVSMINAMIHINPKIINKTKIEDVEYYEFFFEKGSKVFESTTLIKEDTLVYHIFDEIISKCNIPVFLTYEDLGGIFDSANYHAGTKITDNHEVTEMIVSLIAKDAIDKTIPYRNTIKNMNYLVTNEPAFISLSDVQYGVSSTLNKLSGSYFNAGVVSRLVTPTERVNRVEEMLRA